MSSVASGSVTLAAGGLSAEYTDTGTYGTVSSRVLTVFNAQGNVFAGPFNMGSNLTQAVSIPTDQWLQFICVVIDNTGTFTATVNLYANGIYIATFLNRLVTVGCGCNSNQFCDMFKAELNEQAGEWFSLFGLGVAATSAIQAGNVYINTNNPNNS